MDTHHLYRGSRELDKHTHIRITLQKNKINTHPDACKMAPGSTHHILFAAISYPRMSKHSGGHTGEEAAAEQTA